MKQGIYRINPEHCRYNCACGATVTSETSQLIGWAFGKDGPVCPKCMDKPKTQRSGGDVT